MAAGKNPGRILDGPYAQWGAQDENCQIILGTTAASLANAQNTIKLGQPVFIDVTQFGPDNNVMDNGVPPATNYATAEQTIGPLCETVVSSKSANAGPLFGIVTQVESQPGLTQSYVAGVPSWKNTSGQNLLVRLTVRQTGWGYVWVGAGSGVSNACSVGSILGVNSNNAFAIRMSSAVFGQTVGVALATAINTTQNLGPLPQQSVFNAVVNPFSVPAPQGPGLVSIIPANPAGIVTGALLLIDTLASGVQEQVSVSSISYPTFTVNLANAHTGNFPITGPNTNPAAGSMLISFVGTNNTVSGLVATWIDIS